MGFIKMNNVLLDNKSGTMEEFLRKQNLMLMIENAMLREQLNDNEMFLYDEEVEKQYRDYYLENENT